MALCALELFQKMITQDQLIEKLGKQGYQDFVLRNRDKSERMIDIESRKPKGRVKFKMCQHGIVIIDDFESKDECAKCKLAKNDAVSCGEFHPFLSIATGNYYESKSEMKRDYKSHRMQQVGTERIRK